VPKEQTQSANELDLIRDDDFLLVHGWMIKLGLTHTELLVYAKIHSFCADGAHTFHGSIKYLSKWANADKRSVYRSLNTLVENGFIAKNERETRGVKMPEYTLSDLWKTMWKTETAGCKNVTGGDKMSPIDGDKMSLGGDILSLTPYKNTVQSTDIENTVFYDDDDNSRAREKTLIEIVENPVENPVENCPPPPDMEEHIKAVTKAMFAECATRRATPADVKHVKELVCFMVNPDGTPYNWSVGGECTHAINEQSLVMLQAAFQRAGEYGKADTWAYVDSIFANYENNGVTSPADIRRHNAEFECSREDKHYG
jgi:predicted transcriptional regulator